MSLCQKLAWTSKQRSQKSLKIRVSLGAGLQLGAWAPGPHREKWVRDKSGISRDIVVDACCSAHASIHVLSFLTTPDLFPTESRLVDPQSMTPTLPAKRIQAQAGPTRCFPLG